MPEVFLLHIIQGKCEEWRGKGKNHPCPKFSCSASYRETWRVKGKGKNHPCPKFSCCTTFFPCAFQLSYLFSSICFNLTNIREEIMRINLSISIKSGSAFSAVTKDTSFAKINWVSVSAAEPLAILKKWTKSLEECLMFPKWHIFLLQSFWPFAKRQDFYNPPFPLPSFLLQKPREAHTCASSLFPLSSSLFKISREARTCASFPFPLPSSLFSLQYAPLRANTT